MRFEARFSGSGGQGLMLVGLIFAETAIQNGKYNAVQTQAYGPEARGGASYSDVIISDVEIAYPKTRNLNLLLALNPESFNKFSLKVRDDGIVVVDNTFIQVEKSKSVFPFSFTKFATEELENVLVTNVLALGTISYILTDSGYDFLFFEDLIKVIKKRVPSHLLDLNLRAARKGYELSSSIVK